MKTSDKNKILYIISYALRSAALLTATGTVMQTFLSSIAMDADKIYLHTSAVGAVNVTVILLFSRFADTVNVIRRTALVILSGAVLFLFYLPLCFSEKATAFSFILLLTAGCIQSVTTALHTVCDYKLPYYIFRKEEYGSIMAFCGILSSGISFGVGGIITAACKNFSYSTIMIFAYILSFVFMSVAAILTLKLKNIADEKETEKLRTTAFSFKDSIKTVIKTPVFYKLLPANLLRGFASGMTLVFTVIAADNLGYSEEITTLAVSVQALTSLAACALFGILSRHISPRISVFAGSITFLLLPLILIPESPVLFLVITGIIIFGRTLIDYAVPSVLLYAVPSEIAGPYNAYRMILHNGGSLLATTAAAVISPAILLPMGTVMQLISGFIFLFLPLLKKASPLKVKQ